MKIKKNGKVIKLTESDLKSIIKRTLNEQDEVPNFKVSKPLPDCAELFHKQAMEEYRKESEEKKEMRIGPITLDLGNVTLKVVTGPVSPDYEGIYLTKDGDTEQFCKFNIK